MTGNGIVSIGECMLELSGRVNQNGGGEDWRMGFAGDTLNTLWALRALTGVYPKCRRNAVLKWAGLLKQ